MESFRQRTEFTDMVESLSTCAAISTVDEMIGKIFDGELLFKVAK